MHLQENTLFHLDLGGQGHTKCCPVPLTLRDLWHQQSVILLHPTVKEKMHLQENTLFDPVA